MSEPSEMIERIAEAMLLAGLQTNPLYGETSIGPSEMDALRQVTRANRLQYAQAAIRAIREPTDEMLHAAFISPAYAVLPEGDQKMAGLFMAMIDAAL